MIASAQAGRWRRPASPAASFRRVFDLQAPTPARSDGISAAERIARYERLARDAALGGDPVAAQNFLQHAEHYIRRAAGQI